MVISGLIPALGRDGPYMGYTVDILLDQPNVGTGRAKFEAHELIPVNEKYDGNKLTTWNECPFKPKEFVT